MKMLATNNQLPLGSTASRTKLLTLSILLVVLVGWTFLPVLDNGFLPLDDTSYVTGNVHVRDGLTLENVQWAFTSVEPETANWHPLTWLSHMMDCELFGLKPAWHHLTNALLHTLNTLLLFLVLRKMTGALWSSFFVAALFGLHPLRVESVAWIAERKDVLSTLFLLLTIGAYERYARQDACKMQNAESKPPPSESRGGVVAKSGPRRGKAANSPHPVPLRREEGKAAILYYILTLAFYACGLMSKAMLVTVPCVLLLMDFWPLRRFGVRKLLRLLLEKVPFFLATAAVSSIALVAQKAGGTVREDLPFVLRLENALVSYPRYLGKMFYPARLYVFYPHPLHWPAGTLVASGVLLVGITAVAVALWRSQPYFLFGWLWFLGTLVPAIGLVQVGVQAMADRYTYIPMIGIFILLTWGAFELTRRFRFQTVILSGTAVALIIPSILLTRRQIGFWKDGKTLVLHAVTVDPGDYMAHFYLASAFDGEGRLDEAIAEFKEALLLQPNADMYNSFGLFLTRRGRLDEAIIQFQQALRLRPDRPGPHNNLARALFKKRRLDEAIVQFQDALALKPDAADIHDSLGVALCWKGRLDEGIHEFEEALKLNPADREAQKNLAGARASKEASAKSKPPQ
ncbi:MAG TPA: tetratricopeptide repeat protein [Candidatus Binatia bacterium]|jgi:Tfp pilus assembly protein PilF|nr:tetratricopeptide repeat protein [Candidatus Binatia bacterium]